MIALDPAQPLSGAFTAKGISDYLQAALFVKDLPYGRNRDKDDPLCVLKDAYGTCSTKHALLKRLADENGLAGIRLMLCLFKMNAGNTPQIAATLQQYGLDHIPEAHNYLSFNGHIIDCTNSSSDEKDFADELLLETEISPGQITGFKVSFHQHYLAQWLDAHPGIAYTAEEIYRIREQCIRNLESTKT